MKTKIRFLAALIVAGSLSMAATVAVADQVILRNGTVIEGEIESRDDQFVVIRTLTNLVRLPMDRVAEIRESAPGEIELMRAREALRQDRLQEAHRLVEQAREKGASDAQTAEILANLRDREAEIEFARYRELMEKARQAATRGQASEALAELRTLVEEGPENEDLRDEMIEILCDYHLRVATDLKDRVRDEQAIEEFLRVLELDPTRAYAHIEVADIYRRRNSSAAWNKALVSYREALEVGQETLDQRSITRVHWEMAELYRQLLNWREASRHYRKVYERDPNFNYQLRDRFHVALGNHANELRTQDRYDRAVELLDEALAIRTDVPTLVAKGELLALKEQYGESITAFRAALDIAPRTRHVNYQLAMSHFALGELGEGREALEREVELFPDNYEAFCDLGEHALDMGDFEQARTHFETARAIYRHRPRATLGLAKTMRELERYGEARSLAQEILDQQEDHLEANLEMGRILLEDHEEREARNYFSIVLDLINQAPAEEQEKLRELRADALIARGEISLMTAGPGTANIDFRSALEVIPDYGQAYFSIGNAFRRKYNSTKRMTDLQEAEQNMLKARELAPTNPRFALELGILYAEVMSKEVPDMEREYLDKARAQWNDYIEMGGTNVAQVERWIANLGM